MKAKAKKSKTVTAVEKKVPEKSATLVQSNFGYFVTEFRKLQTDIENGSLVKVRELTSKRIENVINESGLQEKYKIISLVQDDDFDISRTTLDDVYASVKDDDSSKHILMILNSPGGYIGPAYFISKCCKEYSNSFSVAVPRRAKSAATLIALGAETIHMGSISELGPIDPQIRKLPALALGDAVDFLASITEKYPGSAEMFARFLSRELDLQNLGHTRRIPDSAADYATRLLGSRKLPKPAKQIAQDFVIGYKDHGFVIDKDEARSMLGAGMVQSNTPEYELADNVYKTIEDMKLALWVVMRKSYIVNVVGDTAGVWLIKKEDE